MYFTEHYTESEKQDARLDPEWLQAYRSFTLVIAWMTGSSGSLLLSSIMKEYYTACRLALETLKIQISVSDKCVSLLHHSKVAEF